MEMKKSIVVVMLSLLAVAGAVAGDGIRLPTGIDMRMLKRYVSAGVATARDGGKLQSPPWECCDFGICTPSFPPVCTCGDEVKSCSAACHVCEDVGDDLYVCRDWYRYGWREQPVPQCNAAVGRSARN